MNVILIALLFFMQLFIFLCYGSLFSSVLHLNIRSLTLTILCGFIFYFCLFGIIALPMILTSQKLSTLTYTIIIVTMLLCIASILLCHQHYFSWIKNLPLILKQHSFMLIPLLIAIFLLQLAVFTHIDTSADASYYIGKVSTDVYTNTMGHYNPYTGYIRNSLDNRRVFACFPEYNAIISQFFHIHPLKQAKLIMPQMLALFTSLLYYQLGLAFFKNHKKADGFVFFMFLLDLYSYTVYTNSTFLITRTYEGKSILANIIIPYMFLCFLFLWKEENLQFTKYFLFAVSLSSCFFSSSSMLIVPAGLSAGLLPWIFKKKSWKFLGFYFLCIIPNLIVCILYVLASKGFLVYPIN